MAASNRLSRRVDDLVASPIREILAVIDRPGMVYFAGGLPASQTFPALRALHLGDLATGAGMLRLNFSHASERDAERGLRTLAGLLREAA